MKFEEAKPRPLPTASTKGVLDDGPPPTTPTRKGWNGRVYSRVPPGAVLPKENHSDSDATREMSTVETTTATESGSLKVSVDTSSVKSTILKEWVTDMIPNPNELRGCSS